MAQQPPAPVVRGQNVERLIHKDTAPLTGAELAAIVIQIVERFDVIDQLPGLARANDRGRKRQGMERHVVLAHELNVAHVGGTLVGAPPAFPVGIRRAVFVGPFLGAGDVLDGGIKPDVEDLAFHAGPGRFAFLDRHAPVEVPRDAPVLQPVAIVEPLLRDRCSKDRPVRLAVDPVGQLAPQGPLLEVEVLGLAHFQIGGT